MANLLDDDEETEQGEAYEQPLPENGNSSEGYEETDHDTWTAQEHHEETLRARQLAHAENKERGAALRARQEAESHASKELLYSLKTKIAERELTRPTASRTQKCPAHLFFKTDNCQNLAMVAAHLHKLNGEQETDRVSFLKQGAGDIPLTRAQENMSWTKLVPSVLRNMSQDYLQNLHELILSPKSQTNMTMPDFLFLKHAASTAVTTYQWLSKLEGNTAHEDTDKAIARMILLSLPGDIRTKAKIQLAGHNDKETTIAVITAILDNTPEAPVGLQPRYGTPTRRISPNEQYAAPLQGGSVWTHADFEKLVSQVVDNRPGVETATRIRDTDTGRTHQGRAVRAQPLL